LQLHFASRRAPTINQERRAFIQNKRCPINPPAIGDVVNRNGASVYQTDAVLICIVRVQRRRSRRFHERQQ
jgi:hypothetical protein